MPAISLFDALQPQLAKGMETPIPSSESATESNAIRATKRTASWCQQIARAYAYQVQRVRNAREREQLDAAYEKAMTDRPDFARVHGGSEFIEAPHCPFDGRLARQIMEQARAIERGTYAKRDKGAHGGVIGKSALLVLEKFLFVIWPAARKGITPCLAAIAERAQLSVRTVQTCLAVLKLLGFLTIIRRVKRVQTALGIMQQQDTNAYALHLPKGLGAIGAGLFAGVLPDGKNFQAKESIFHLYGFEPAGRQEECGVKPLRGFS